jgi:uncharacterized membrane protein
MEATLAPYLKLAHVFLAFILVAGLLGRWVLLRRAARSEDIERSHLLAEAASPFERAVQFSSLNVALVGMVTAWAQGYPWLGLTTGWMLLTVLLIIPIIVMIPAIFLPRGRVFEAAMADARAKGIVTPALRAAWADPAVRFARRYELVSLVVIVALMVLKPTF